MLIAKRHNIVKFNISGGIIEHKIIYVLGKKGGAILERYQDAVYNKCLAN